MDTRLIVESISNSLTNLFMDHIDTEDHEDIIETRKLVYKTISKRTAQFLISTTDDFLKAARKHGQTDSIEFLSYLRSELKSILSKYQK